MACRQQWVSGIVPSRFPLDFPDRLERYMEAVLAGPCLTAAGGYSGASSLAQGDMSEVDGELPPPGDGACHSSVSKESDCTNDGEPDEEDGQPRQ